MTTLEIILGVVLIFCALMLIIIVLLQDSSDHNMSGVIAGGADNIFGKNKAKATSKKLNIATVVIAVVLVAVVLVFYLQQFVSKPSGGTNPGSTETAAQAEVVTEENGGTEAAS